jgi:hypothetical protein
VLNKGHKFKFLDLKSPWPTLFGAQLQRFLAMRDRDAIRQRPRTRNQKAEETLTRADPAAGMLFKM